MSHVSGSQDKSRESVLSPLAVTSAGKRLSVLSHLTSLKPPPTSASSTGGCTHTTLAAVSEAPMAAGVHLPRL